MFRDHPDWFDDKGNLLEEYSKQHTRLEYALRLHEVGDPMYGLVQCTEAVPEPHSKWDKIWIDANTDMTLQELVYAVTAKLRELGASESVEVSFVSGVVKNVKNEHGGNKMSSKVYWNPLMPSTRENMSKKWIELLKEKDGVDASGSDFLLCNFTIETESSMTFVFFFTIENVDTEALVETPPILLRLKPLCAFKPFSKAHLPQPATAEDAIAQ